MDVARLVQTPEHERAGRRYEEEHERAEDHEGALHPAEVSRAL
jgi:hypothetical protein